jgi:CheY-like chemotaxis protein
MQSNNGERRMARIMIVDDDPDCLYTIKQALELMDNEYEIIIAHSGIECLELLKTNDLPDLILLDIMMPEMSGWETIKNIQQNKSWRDIPVAFLTSRTDDVAKKTGNFLAEDYIVKPFVMEDLKERIEKILKKTGRFHKDDIQKKIDKVLSSSGRLKST